MEKLKQILRLIKFHPLPALDYYSDQVEDTGEYKEYKGCHNNNLICKSTLLKVINQMDWCILSAYDSTKNKSDNIKRNYELRKKLNQLGMKVYLLAGRWWVKDKKNKFVDIVERFFLVKVDSNKYSPNGINQNIRISMMEIDVVMFKFKNSCAFLVYNKSGFVVLNNVNTLEQIQKVYGQEVLKLTTPFSFLGVEIPGSNGGCALFKHQKVKWI